MDAQDEALTDTLEEWLLPMIAGGKFRTKGHLAQLDMLSILKNQLAYSDQQLVDVRVPLARRAQRSHSERAPWTEERWFGVRRGPTRA